MLKNSCNNCVYGFYCWASNLIKNKDCICDGFIKKETEKEKKINSKKNKI